VFTQTGWDAEGYAIRDPDSTTYIGAIETAEAFGKRLYVEAWNRGWSRARKKVVFGDGPEWIWNLADQHFRGAVHIVDLFRARQHLWDLARSVYPRDQAQQKVWMRVHQDLLDRSKLRKLIVALRSIRTDNPELAEKLCVRITGKAYVPRDFHFSAAHPRRRTIVAFTIPDFDGSACRSRRTYLTRGNYSKLTQRN